MHVCEGNWYLSNVLQKLQALLLISYQGWTNQDTATCGTLAVPDRALVNVQDGKTNAEWNSNRTFLTFPCYQSYVSFMVEIIKLYKFYLIKHTANCESFWEIKLSCKQLKSHFTPKTYKVASIKANRLPLCGETNGSLFTHQHETHILGINKSQTTKFLPWHLTRVATQFVKCSVPPFCGALNFEMAPGFIENMCTPDGNTVCVCVCACARGGGSFLFL